MDAQEYATVIRSICSKLGDITPNDTLIRNVTLYCKGLNHNKLKKQYDLNEERNEAIATSYIKSIQSKKDFDYSDYVRKADNKDKASITALATAKKSFEPLTNWLGERMPLISSKTMSVYLDSRVRNYSGVSSASITDFAFTLVPRQTRAEIGDGRVQVRVMPSQITYFKIGKIVLPYGTSLRQHNYMNELTLTFTALRSNGIIGREDTYHFTFTYKPSASNVEMVELAPVNEFCKFDPPLRIIDDLTLRFNDPLYPINFPKDRLNSAQFNYLSSDGRIAFNEQHGLNDNDIIIVMGLKTNADASNASILSTINNPRGIAVTKIDNYVISLNIDFTKIISPDTTSKPLIFFYSKMFRFPLEIGYQDIVEL